MHEAYRGHWSIRQEEVFAQQQQLLTLALTALQKGHQTEGVSQAVKTIERARPIEEVAAKNNFHSTSVARSVRLEGFFRNPILSEVDADRHKQNLKVGAYSFEMESTLTLIGCIEAAMKEDLPAEKRTSRIEALLVEAKMLIIRQVCGDTDIETASKVQQAIRGADTLLAPSSIVDEEVFYRRQVSDDYDTYSKKVTLRKDVREMHSYSLFVSPRIVQATTNAPFKRFQSPRANDTRPSVEEPPKLVPLKDKDHGLTAAAAPQGTTQRRTPPKGSGNGR